MYYIQHLFPSYFLISLNVHPRAVFAPRCNSWVWNSSRANLCDMVMQVISFSTGMGDLMATVGNFTSKMSRNFTQLVKEKEKLKKELISGKESFENIKNINADGDVDD